MSFGLIGTLISHFMGYSADQVRLMRDLILPLLLQEALL
jgi:hypothetical protein